MPKDQLMKLQQYSDVLQRMIPYLSVTRDKVPPQFTLEKVGLFERQINQILETFKRRRNMQMAQQQQQERQQQLLQQNQLQQQNQHQQQLGPNGSLPTISPASQSHSLNVSNGNPMPAGGQLANRQAQLMGSVAKANEQNTANAAKLMEEQLQQQQQQRMLEAQHMEVKEQQALARQREEAQLKAKYEQNRPLPTQQQQQQQQQQQLGNADTLMDLKPDVKPNIHLGPLPNQQYRKPSPGAAATPPEQPVPASINQQQPGSGGGAPPLSRAAMSRQAAAPAAAPGPAAGQAGTQETKPQPLVIVTPGISASPMLGGTNQSPPLGSAPGATEVGEERAQAQVAAVADPVQQLLSQVSRLQALLTKTTLLALTELLAEN